MPTGALYHSTEAGGGVLHLFAGQALTGPGAERISVRAFLGPNPENVGGILVPLGTLLTLASEGHGRVFPLS